MKKVLKITLIATILFLCNAVIVSAVTNEELITYAKKTFTVAGQQLSLSAENKRKVERYLTTYPVNDTQAGQIKGKIDSAVALMNSAGTANPEKLSEADRDKLLKIGQEAAAIAGATITYNADTKTLSIYRDGVLFDEASTIGDVSLVQTGSDYSYMIYTIIAVAVIATASVVIFKMKSTKNGKTVDANE